MTFPSRVSSITMIELTREEIMSKAGKMHGELVGEEEVAKGLGFADVNEFRRWQTELGRKNAELEHALSQAKDEAKRFRWHGMRQEFILGKAEEFLKRELATAKTKLSELDVPFAFDKDPPNPHQLRKDLQARIAELEKLILAAGVVSGRGVDWNHVLSDWLDRFNKSNEEIAAERINELKGADKKEHDALCYCTDCLGGDPPRPEDEDETTQ